MWDRITALYVRLQDARHAVTHRRAHAGPSGELKIYDDQRGLTDTISGAETASFVAAVHAVAEAVVDRDPDPRRVNIVAWHLNSLCARHGLPQLSAADAEVGRRLLIMDLTSLRDTLVQFDVARAREIVAGQPPGLWDLELRTAQRVLVGRWEDVPDNAATAVDFALGSPPSWLSHQPR